MSKIKIIDCFTFYNELDMLYYRLENLYDIVDFFILVEAHQTYKGNEKILYYNDNIKRFDKFNDKIIHIISELPYKGKINIENREQWKNENFQRESIHNGILKLNLSFDDIIIISDLDEIPDPDKIKQFKEGKIILNKGLSLEQDFYYYNLNCIYDRKWNFSKIVTYSEYITSTPEKIRKTDYPIEKKSGWHLSYFGNHEFIQNKIKEFSHQEYNNNNYTSLDIIYNRIYSNKDLYGREDHIITYLPIEKNKYLPPNYLNIPSYTTNNIKTHIPDCTIVTCCYDLTIFNNKSLSFDEILKKIDIVLQLHVYLVIFTDDIFFDKIQKIRHNYGLSKFTLVLKQNLENLWSYKYINQVKSNREKYLPTIDERTSSESHLITCNKFDFVLQIIDKNPFNTTKFSWLDSFLGIDNKMRICENYNHDKFLNIFNNITDKFHIQIINANNKKYKLDKNKKEYYNTYKYVVAGGFFTCGKQIGIKILNRLKEIFIKTTILGFGHGEEMLYLEILDEFYDDIEKSYGDYGQIINNFIQIETNFNYIYYNIIKKYLDYGYNKECYDCCKKVIIGIENTSIIDYNIYFMILFSLYISSFYNRKDSISIVNKIYHLCNKNNIMNDQLNKNKIFYEEQFKYCNFLKPQVRIIFCIMGCATIEKYKNQILKINQTWGKKTEEKNFKILYFLGEEKTDLLDSKYIYLEGIDNTYSSASYKQNLGLKYIYENYNVDFVYVCGTDTYINIEKLSLYLNKFNKEEHLYIGGHGDKRKIGNDEIYFHSGGSGFILSNKSLEFLYTKLWNSHNNWINICNNSNNTYLIDSCDVQIAYNLKNNIEFIKDNESFYSCNYKGFSSDNNICCASKIKIDKIISCHNMSLSDFDEFTILLENNNYYLHTEYFYNRYNNLCNTKSDINEHLHTLSFYASKCENVLELGVRGVVASWALAYGLLKNNKNKKYLFMNDLNECDNSEILEKSKNTELIIEFKWINDLLLTFDKNFDMVFIDTWHVYGQLKRELNKFSKITNKYIIMHDTTIDEWYGELLRYNGNAKDYTKETGFLVEEINMGLWPAIVEFICNNPEWKIKERFTNNNGLTILERI